MINGKPARATVELPPVIWTFDAGMPAPPLTDALPDSIRRIDLTDGSRRVTRR